MRNDNCPDCSSLTGGACEKHTVAYFEPSAKSIDQFKQEIIAELEKGINGCLADDKDCQICLGYRQAIEIIKSK